jgi:hypothetical protein
MKYPSILSILALLATLAPLGCGSLPGGTGTGNPGVSVTSRPYYTSLSGNSLFDFLIPRAHAANGTITSLFMCVTKLEFEGPSGEISVPRADLGLIDLDSGRNTVLWGELLTTGTMSVDEINIEIHHDPETCGGFQHSMQANGQGVTKDIELEFKFAQTALIGQSGTITFSLANVAQAIEQALAAGQFDNEHVASYFGTFKDSAESSDD